MSAGLANFVRFLLAIPGTALILALTWGFKSHPDPPSTVAKAYATVCVAVAFCCLAAWTIRWKRNRLTEIGTAALSAFLLCGFFAVLGGVRNSELAYMHFYRDDAGIVFMPFIAIVAAVVAGSLCFLPQESEYTGP